MAVSAGRAGRVERAGRAGRPGRGERDGAGARCVLLLAVAAVGLALAHADPEKRAEMAPVPFMLSSRYGRSPPRLLAPRSDRFIMGSRYGKRSGAEWPPEPPASALAALTGGSGTAAAGPGLLCEHVMGAPPSLYRCRPAPSPLRHHLFDDRINDSDPNVTEED